MINSPDQQVVIFGDGTIFIITTISNLVIKREGGCFKGNPEFLDVDLVLELPKFDSHISNIDYSQTTVLYID